MNVHKTGTRIMRSKLFRPAVWALTVLSGAIAHAAPAAPSTEKVDPAAVELFEKKVRPVFAQQCYKCHSNTADKLKAGLFMDSREGLLKGGTTGPAIVPGHPEKSLLIEAIKYGNSDLQMPPKNQLSAAVIADISRWIQMGAPFPGGAKVRLDCDHPARGRRGRPAEPRWHSLRSAQDHPLVVAGGEARHRSFGERRRLGADEHRQARPGEGGIEGRASRR